VFLIIYKGHYLYKIYNKTKKTIIVNKVRVADTFYSRLVGLLNKKSLSSEEALLITHCQSIHMFFMKFSIDVIFVNKKNIVVGLVKNIKPFALSRIFFKASYAIEGAVGMIDKGKVEKGDVLILQQDA